jgi:hypothetical protein
LASRNCQTTTCVPGARITAATSRAEPERAPTSAQVNASARPYLARSIDADTSALRRLPARRNETAPGRSRRETQAQQVRGLSGAGAEQDPRG